MRNADVIRERLDRVKQMKSYTEALNALADIQYDIGMEACAEREVLKAEVERLRVILLGNGSPEEALVTRVKSIEECYQGVGQDLKEIKDALLGTTDGSQKGLVYRMDVIESLHDDWNKGKWIVIGIVLTQIAVAILGLL